MAEEKLIFPIGFDLEGGVKEVQKQWNTAHKQLQDEMSKKPLKLKVELDTKKVGLKDLNEYIKLSKEAKKATEDAAKAAKLAADMRSKEAMARNRESKARVQEATEKAQITLKNNQAAISEMRLADAKQNGIRATNEQSKAYGKQLTYIKRLFQRLVIVGGLYRAMSFVENIRKTTAEFELQRVALGALIGNLERANTLFEQIKAAAVKSPFQIGEMVGFTKQLAAYKIGVNELFDTTMRLADISAGLGVSMDRLVLAYGQIRAAGYLRASEIRQLTEAGLPIVEELAKKLSMVRGELVSAGEVMQMVSERAISFGMVKDIFEDMTNAGGLFYKMQEKQAETLMGRWSNMKDSLAIMYDEIGRTKDASEMMNAFIGIVKYLATNWRDVASVLKTVTYTYGIYFALSKTGLAITKLQTLYITRYKDGVKGFSAAIKTKIAVEKGEIAMGKLKILQAKQLALANKGLAGSTTWVTAALWKLWAAMLANPLTSIITIVGAVVTAFAIFGKKTKEVGDGIENLYEKIEATRKEIKEFTFKSDAIKPLVDEFDTLASKTDKTAKEQERYNQLIGELANKAPEVVAAYKNMQGTMGEALAKMMKTPEAVLRNMLKAYEEQLKEEQEKIETLTENLSKGTKTEVDVKYAAGKELPSFDYKEVEFTSNEILELSEQLNNAKENAKELFGIISEIKTALGEGEPIILTGWKEQFKSFKKEVGGIERTLFTEEELESIYNLSDALEETAKSYKENKEKADIYGKALASLKKKQDEAKKSGKIFDDKGQIAEIEKNLEKTTALKDLAYEALKYYDALNLLDSKKKPKDTRLADLKDQINDLTNAYKKFVELRKYKFEPEALADIEKLFPSLKDFKPTQKNVEAKLEQMLKDVKKQREAKPKDTTLIDMERELEKSLANIKFDKLKTDLEEKLSRLADQVSKTKAAKEFYDKILGMTGDRELSATFTMSVYGETGEDLAKRTVEQIQTAFDGVDLSDAINYNNFQVNWQKLTKIYEENQDKMLEKNRDTAKKLIENAQQVTAKQAEQWLKDLEKVKTYADKRIELSRKTAEKIKEIEQSTLPETERETLIEQYKQREAKEASKLEYEAFKESPAYVEMFSNLDNVSTRMLNHLRGKITELQSEWNNLDPTQLKELQSRLEKIDEQLIKRNPFKALIKSVGDYFKMLKTGSRQNAELELANALKEQYEAHETLEKRIKDVNEAQKKYDDNKAKYGEDDARTKSSKTYLENAKKLLYIQEGLTNATDENVNSAQNLVVSWDSITSAASAALSEVNGIVQSLGQTSKQIYEAFGGFGGDEADKELFNSVVDGISKTTQGITDLAKGITTGDPISIINGIGSAISGIADLAYSGRIYRANKELASQQERIESLEYAYSNLEKAMESALGSDYISNYTERVKNLTAQQKAYLKQAEAERSKGKRADQAKIKEYEESARDTADNIKDMYGELQEYFLGVGLSDAARELANSWLEAKKEIGDATKAIEERIAEMIENMVVEAGAADIAKAVMEPFYNELEKLSTDEDYLTATDIVTLAKMIPQLAENMNVGLTNYFETLKEYGYDITKTASNLSGISKDIATASEESILGLAAGINTQNFYISQIHSNVAMLTQWIMDGGMGTQGVNVADLITIQNQHLAHLPNIAVNTASTLAECRNILTETRRVADNLDRVIKPKGIQTTHVVYTSL